MEEAIKYYFNKIIKEKIKLENGWKESWLITLSDHQKVVFRAYSNYTELFEREKLFYDTVNSKIGKTCPEIYVVDGSCDYYDKAFQISEYIEGKALRYCLQEELNDRKKENIYYEIGQLIAQINQIEADVQSMYPMGRDSWEAYYSNFLMRPQLLRIVANDLITIDEIDLICEKMQAYPASKANRLLHRDIRPDNLIFRNGRLFLIDAETSEIGDPLDELARIHLEWHYWEMYDTLLKGYKNVLKIDTDNILFYFYQLEELGELLDMHYNHGCNNSTTPFFRNCFREAKEKVLRD